MRHQPDIICTKKPPFEPLAVVPLRELIYKVLCLVAVTTAQRLSELRVLLINPELCIFHRDRVVLRVDPTFLNKAFFTRHRG